MKLYKQFLLVPVVLALFSYLFYSTYKYDKERVLQEFNSQQFALAKQASGSIESFFIYFQEELLFLSKFNNISQLNDQGKNLLTDFYKNHSDQIEAIFLIAIVMAVFFYMAFKSSSKIKERRLVNRELVSAKERAEESDRLKSAFLTNMSHELRTPLNAIIGYTGLMIDSGLAPDINSNLKIISNSAYQLLSLVEDIIDISMIETEQIKIIKKEVRINSILSELNETFNEEILKINKTETKLVLKTSPEINEIQILTDSRKLKQVFIILIKNALKFTSEGYIEFGVMNFDKADSKYLKFFVKDTGIGINSDQYDVIFNIFRQIDDSHTRKYGGTGIGLTIAKKLIEILGGEIWVESEPGKGSVFYFTVPIITNNVN